MPEFWVIIFAVAPALGWMADYVKATVPRRIGLAFFFAIPLILFAAYMLAAQSAPHQSTWVLIGLVMAAVFEVPWIGLVVLGLALHRRMRGIPFG